MTLKFSWAALSSLFLLFPILVASAACPAPPQARSEPKYPEGLDVFKFRPLSPPVSGLVKAYTPLQFNGSVPGAQDTTEHLGWFVGDDPETKNDPVDVVSFVQYNKKKGIVFWAEGTRLEVLLEPVNSKARTFAVKLGWSENPKARVGKFTITKFLSHAKVGKWVFGWDGNYGDWFVCGSRKSGFYGLYYGERLKGCSRKFHLEVKYLK